jgi:hypothetical protein
MVVTRPKCRKEQAQENKGACPSFARIDKPRMAAATAMVKPTKTHTPVRREINLASL